MKETPPSEPPKKFKYWEVPGFEWPANIESRRIRALVNAQYEKDAALQAEYDKVHRAIFAQRAQERAQRLKDEEPPPPKAKWATLSGWGKAARVAWYIFVVIAYIILGIGAILKVFYLVGMAMAVASAALKYVGRDKR